ncbi:MAG: hypothetical protein A2X84_11200 [Desulfuromonadaceae bacterium GWC2_58_13]|nr:MAG: hypothetical protein A2X84_11200 [Desulfuromonadaceae bacterium GWC2_58_13]
MRIPPCISFAAFVFWLLAVPMDGPLLAAAGIAGSARLFLPAHALSLTLIALFLPSQRFRSLAPAGVISTVGLTLFLFIRPDLAQYLLLLLGFFGAFTTMAACLSLEATDRPIFNAALGLATGNLGLFLFGFWPGATIWHFLLTALPLLTIRQRTPIIQGASDAEKLWHYLPFILIFHVASGLMYGFLFPAYQQAAAFSGIELPFYIVAVFGAARLAPRHRDLLLICGIVLNMAAFALLQMGHATTTNLSMYAMQAGAGFVDLFLLAFLLAFPKPMRAFGLGLATLCLGIFCGQIISRQLEGLPQGVSMAGGLVLNLSLLSLYFIGRKQHRSAIMNSDPEFPRTADMPHYETTFVPQVQLPENIRLLLSQQECQVLLRSLAGKTYRETASELTISESTVKTYMKRVQEKLGVSGRKELLSRLADS